MKVRWIDINKGDTDNPIMRSRLVGKEFNDGNGEGLFAGTPPLEALRMLVSDAATGGGVEKVVMINDVATAFFGASMRRTLCVELPREEENMGDQIGLLVMSRYGTRDAAVNFYTEVSRFMKRVIHPGRFGSISGSLGGEK